MTYSPQKGSRIRKLAYLCPESEEHKGIQIRPFEIAQTLLKVSLVSFFRFTSF